MAQVSHAAQPLATYWPNRGRPRSAWARIYSPKLGAQLAGQGRHVLVRLLRRRLPPRRDARIIRDVTEVVLARDGHGGRQHDRQHDRRAMSDLGEPHQSDDGQAGENAHQDGKENEGGRVELRLFGHPSPDEPHRRSNGQRQAEAAAQRICRRGRATMSGWSSAGARFHAFMVRDGRPAGKPPSSSTEWNFRERRTHSGRSSEDEKRRLVAAGIGLGHDLLTLTPHKGLLRILS